MPAMAHFQVAKTVYDHINRKTKADTPQNRREIIAELRPVLQLLGRQESTAQAMLDVLMRIGCVERNPSRDYIVVGQFNPRKFALEVDRNRDRKMIITFVNGKDLGSLDCGDDETED